ncbi:transcription factor bHLH162-like [Nicotiana sylvestris]|uniref:transcription factor bHLH162-like n=1 Tax=Nicotiana sylvestris TaxID=4096 RepID=UPI00388CA7A9
MESGLRSNSAPKLERKYVEKNRRNNMKNLYNQLYSLLPNHASKETLTLPDQLDTATNYIKSLETKLKKKKKYMEELRISRKRPQSFNATNSEPSSSTKSLIPHIEFHEMSPTMFVVLITGLDNLATFYNVIQLLHEEGVEVVYSNFSLNGNSMLQISLETKMDKNSTMEFRATTLFDKLKELLYGSSRKNYMESHLHLWEYIFESELMLLLCLPCPVTPTSMATLCD